ncbi:unnamed protein product [Menidia menidia]|uniref:(Atlantic silverside) hypothetical protein n=1 Tax=Menidia menidia TaxID=238744 RepID=A0A8S4ATB9_9TELE|nr:unnamed protein product [Menidia menidia]
MTSSRPQSPTPPTGTVQVNITSGAAPVSGATETETPTRAELSPKSHLTSTSPEFTTQFPSSASTESTISTSLAGILNPREPKRGSVSTPKPGPATSAAPTEEPKTPPSNEVQPCSNRAVVRQCLVVIGALAALATAFMVSTIVLCARLSARKPNARRPQQMTEMMCISSLLPERNHNYTRQRNPITNGVLVFPAAGDSDEDGGDNLTLSSFLPENERYV